ncbi:MAG: DNA repair protein RadA [Chloroflexi bacterium]|nr:DNA repair protein RadA [Chloroflexota bacterium]
MSPRGAGTTYVCQQCGGTSPRWLGRCPECQEWNSLVEMAVPSLKDERRPKARGESGLQELSHLAGEPEARLSSFSREFDRVLGGGMVPGSLVLVGGDPGIGKSTLLLQVAAHLGQRGASVCYVSGEESAQQIKLRARRLGLSGEGIFILPETDLEAILSQLRKAAPSLVIIDSIQTMQIEDLASAAGSVSQVRECTLRLMHWAKEAGVPLILVGHVTKDGTIAGPRTLEHIVDVVLYLEGEATGPYRLLRGVKNRYGSTNEVGVFQMGDDGLSEVENPSLVFLEERPAVPVGSTVVPVLEGTRPLLMEIQALASPTAFGLPRRTANGVDLSRLLLVAAVLTRRAGLSLSNQDIIVNVVGGLTVTEPAADLGMALAIASSLRDRPVNPKAICFGEVGLSGELRTVSQMERRLEEAARLGFQCCILPAAAAAKMRHPTSLRLLPAATLAEALTRGLA